MTGTIARPSDIIVAAVATVLVHALLFSALIVMAVLEIISQPSQMIVPPPPPEVSVVIRPEMFQRPPAVAEPVPETKPQHVRTSPDQVSEEPPEKTNLIGEHTTRAASELPPDPTAVALPSQDGEAPRRPDQVETVNSTFSDGEQPDLAVATPMEAQPAPGDPTLKPRETEASATSDTVAPEPGAPPVGAMEEELYKTRTQVDVPVMEEGEKPEDEKSLPKESESQSEPEEAKPSGGEPDSKKAEEQKPSEPGFRTEARKTRLQGAIGRRGPSSRDVESTALGRYQAALSRAVEREWQRNCIRHREHITPGMLTIRFLVDARGRVSGIRFIDVVASNEIEKGITLNSVRSADIPSMPKAVARDMDGEPLELIYNFFF